MSQSNKFYLLKLSTYSVKLGIHGNHKVEQILNVIRFI